VTLISFATIQKDLPVNNGKIGKKLPEGLNVPKADHFFSADPDGVMTKHLDKLIPGQDKHYWSYGNFNMMRLLFWILEQTGPAEIILSTYSISPKTLQGVINRQEKGIIKNIRFIVDNRVRSLSPKPFALLAANFEYRCTAIHAKVACVWNENWKLSVVSSQNATDNPKIERGTIHTSVDVFEFDKRILEDVFNSGTT
jgi:hypothetical protein